MRNVNFVGLSFSLILLVGGLISAVFGDVMPANAQWQQPADETEELQQDSNPEYEACKKAGGVTFQVNLGLGQQNPDQVCAINGKAHLQSFPDNQSVPVTGTTVEKIKPQVEEAIEKSRQ